MLRRMRSLLFILLFASAVAAAAEVYRWLDEEGEVHYSDRPHEDAEIVRLPKAPAFSAPAPAPQKSNDESDMEKAGQAGQGENKNKVSYSAVSIISPLPGEVLNNTGGLVKVSVGMQPNLRRGHMLMVYLDDKKVKNLIGNQRETELTEVSRGEHTLRAEVRDAGGEIVGTGNSVTFTVLQTSILNPNNPNVPIPTPR